MDSWGSADRAVSSYYWRLAHVLHIRDDHRSGVGRQGVDLGITSGKSPWSKFIAMDQFAMRDRADSARAMEQGFSSSVMDWKGIERSDRADKEALGRHGSIAC